MDDNGRKKSLPEQAAEQSNTGADDIVDPYHTPGRRMKMVEMQVSRSFSGPLPHPDILVGYANAAPEAKVVDRIVTMAESAQQHDQAQEKAQLKAVTETDRRGQRFALIVSVLMIGGAVYLMSAGNPVSGGAVLAALSGMAYLFLTGKKEDNR